MLSVFVIVQIAFIGAGETGGLLGKSTCFESVRTPAQIGNVHVKCQAGACMPVTSEHRRIRDMRIWGGGFLTASLALASVKGTVSRLRWTWQRCG